MSSARVASLLTLALLVPIALPLVPAASAATGSPPAGLPTFGVFPGPASTDSGSDEPTIGINPETGAVFFQNSATTWQVDFNMAANPVTATWTIDTPPNSIANIDPMLFTDLGTGRTFAGGLDGECSIMSYTDDDGENWVPMGNLCAGAFDHQTIVSGPWAEPRPPNAIAERAVYYCAQGWVNWPENACVFSLDGGIAYSPPVNWQGPCFGLHGHANISRNGYAYVPTRTCNGSPGYAYTRDNGLTWLSKNFPAYAAPSSGFDTSMGSSSDNTLWFAFESSTWLPMVMRSTDNGDSWSTPVQVGEDLGLKTATFLRVMSGDPDRAALAFLGSTTDGNPFVSNFKGVWHLYVAYTYDAGQTWSTVQVTQDPVQRGWMCAGGLGCGSGRNLLDFMGSTIGPKGEVLVGFADGCVGTCAGPSGTAGQSTHSWSTVARQLTGRGLYAEHDGANVDIVGALLGAVGQPLTLTANVAATAPYEVTLSWGDGATETVSGQTLPTFTRAHTYATDGQFPVTITVEGADGATASDTAQASVSGGTGGAIQITSPAEGQAVGDAVTVTGVVEADSNAAPEAAFTFTTSGFAASFNAAGSSDPDGDALTFAWNFGDSTTGSGVSPSHTFLSAGSYNVCLTASDGLLSDQLCQAVAIGGGSSTVLATDPTGDATFTPIAGGPSGPNVPSLDITELKVQKTAEGEPTFTTTIADMSIQPPLTEGAVGAQWSVQWEGPMGTDAVEMTSILGTDGSVTTSCSYGTITVTGANSLYEQLGSLVCSYTEGPNGKVTLTWPAAGLAARGYTASTILTDVTGVTGATRGTPAGTPGVTASSTIYYDSTAPAEYGLSLSNAPWALHGIPTRAASKPAPTTPPADPEIEDTVSNPIGDNVPHTNVLKAWFDSDQDKLYVGMEIDDIPADPTSTAFISYSVNFKPTWEVGDASWFGLVNSADDFTGLRAFALYSPVRGYLGCCLPPDVDDPPSASSDTATVFELHVLSTDGTQNFFGSAGIVEGEIDATTDIIWWAIPRSLLQNPGGGDILEATSAESVPAVGGVVTFGTLYGDATGTGDNYQFPNTQVTNPTVVLSATPANGPAPLQVTFTATVTPTNVASWSMDFGDSTAPQTGNGALPASFTHTYASAGSYTASLTVNAPNGGTGTGTRLVTATSAVPALVVRVDAPGLAPVTATCTAGCATWTADLDLATLAEGAHVLTASLVRNGEVASTDSVSIDIVRTVGVVIDAPADGARVLAGDVNVSGRLAGPRNLAPVASLSADRAEGLAPLPVQFTLGGTDDDAVTTWTFATGDGTVVNGAGSELPKTVGHTYTSAGTYSATLTVRDAAGATDSETGIIRVQNANTAPTAPHSPVPADGATGVALPVMLAWQAEDADGNTLTYDVHIDGQVYADQTSSLIPSGLDHATTYTWHVVAKDGITETVGPSWTFTTAPKPAGESEKPHVVVAMIDTGGNPYHRDFYRPHLTENPATYIRGLAKADQINLCFFDNATKTIQTSGCPGTMSAAWAQDAAQWSQLSVSGLAQTGANQGDVAWIAGTNVFMVSFAHDASYGAPVGVDAANGVMDSHGSWVSSNVAGNMSGTCPECFIVVIETDSVDAVTAAYKWAANQPWIDVITSSTSIGGFFIGLNPADYFDAQSAGTRLAAQNGKLFFEAAGNGALNYGLVPTSTFLHANSAPWSIPVGCAAEHTGQPCGYHDFPNAITASGVARQSTAPKSYGSFDAVGGTSFSSPSTAGVAARALLAARAAMNDTAEGPDTTGAKSILRVGPGEAAPATGPFADGTLTRLEFEEAVLKTARRDVLPKVPNYELPNDEIPNSPLGFVKEGFGQVYRGDWGINHATAQPGWSSSGDITSVILGEADLPNRFVEEFWWEQIVTTAQIAAYGQDDLPDTDNDAYPRDDAPDPLSILGNPEVGTSILGPQRGASAVVPLGTVPTPSNKRLYLHHNDLGPDPASPGSVNSVYENYINNIADPANGAPTCSGVSCPDRSGVGATGVNPLGGFTATYPIDHPLLGGVIQLDPSKEIVVHVESKGYGAQGQSTPPSPLTMTFTLTSGETVVGTGTANRVLNGAIGVYEARFSPLSDFITDVAQLQVSWPGPVYSSHLVTRGASWIELPITATLPPVTYEAVTYYVDNADAEFSPGATVTLTRDIADLSGDADMGQTYVLALSGGTSLDMNLVSNDDLVDAPALLGPAGSLTLYPCTFPFGDVGFNMVTIQVGLRVGDQPIGGGSITTQVPVANLDYYAVEVPLKFHQSIVPKDQPLEGIVTMSSPAGYFTPNMGVCGGGEMHPIALTMSIGALDVAPKATITPPGGTLSGQVTLGGTATFPPVPALATKTWYATNAGDWTLNGDVLEMDTTAPGTSSATFFEPTPGGVTVSFRSVRPAVADIDAIATDGVAYAQFWASPIGGSQDLTVDLTVLLEDAQGNQRLLGQASTTKHILVDPVALNPWPDGAFVLSFVPQVATADADEHLVMRFNVHNAGTDVLASNVVFFGGDSAQPIYLALPRDGAIGATGPKVDVTLGGFTQLDVPVTDGAWSVSVDTNTIGNGAHTLRVTPKATYDGTVRVGAQATRAVQVQNQNLNTAPTATLALTPASGVAPLVVSAALGGSDAQTAASQLTYRIDWGDGSAVETGTGLPATLPHTYAQGAYTAVLTVTDAGGLTASKTQSVVAGEQPPVEKLVLILDGGAPIDAVDAAGDGSFALWYQTLSIPTPGIHTVTARHVRTSQSGTETLNEDTITLDVYVPDVPDVIIATADHSAVSSASAITGTVSQRTSVTSVDASIDGFATSVPVSSNDGYATWTLAVSALGLPEDVETRVDVRAVGAEGTGTSFVRVTLDAKPEPRIDVSTALPAGRGEPIDFVGSATPSATGAAIVGFAWDFGDGATGTGANPSHSYASSGTKTVTLTVTDADGASESTTRDVLILNAAPQVTLSATPASPTDLDTVTITTSATDADGPIASITTTAYNGATRESDVLATGGATLDVVFPDDGTYLLVGRAVDDEGAASEVESLIVVSNVRPVAHLLASAAEVGVGQTVELDASGSSDPDGDIVEYRFDLGDGTIVVQDTPLLTHEYSSTGTFLATVTVFDDDGASIMSDAVSIKANGAPILGAIGHKVVDEGQPLTFTATATDPENDPLTFALTPLPSGAVFDTATGVFAWTPAYGQNGNYPVTVSVTDGFVTDSEAIIISVGDVNLPPTLVPIGPKTVLENTQLAFALEASDPDTGLTFSAAPLPNGAVFDTMTGAFVWTPTFAQAGLYEVTFSVNDGLTTLAEIVTITVQNNDRLPTLNAISNLTIYQGSSIDVALQAMDADGEPISFAHTGPAGISIVNQGNGAARLRWTIGVDTPPGEHAVKVFAMAGEGTATREFTIRVLFKTAVSVTPVTSTTTSASPGETRTLVSRVTNTGPNVDTFRVTATNNMGWVVSSVPTEVTLAPGATVDVPVDVLVNGSKPVSWTTVVATSLGDPTVSKNTRFRVDVPVLVTVTPDAAIAFNIDSPSGVVLVTHLDGTPAIGANVRVTQTPATVSSLRTTQSGTTNETGAFVYDFNGEPNAMVPGEHSLVIVASKAGGFETVHETSYTIDLTPDVEVPDVPEAPSSSPQFRPRATV